MDIWLQRISQFSQLGLFLVTLGTIYFTVIPLYQKSLLDEEIARKEIILENLKKQLNASYIKIRNSAVDDFIRHAALKCSGVFIDRPRTLSEAVNRPSSIIDSVISIKPEDCLSKAIEISSLSSLKQKDLALLQAEVARIGRKLELLRKEALRKHNAAVEEVEITRDQLSDNSLTGVFAELFLKTLPPEDIVEINFDREVSKKQFDTELRYADEVRSQISKLNSLNWPPTNVVEN